MTLLLLYVGLALAFSFLCSILEAVLLTLTPSYVATLREIRPRIGARLERYKTNIDKPLAAILSLNTIAHTAGAAVAGAQAAKVFGDRALGVFSAVLILLILYVSEIIPKTLGAVFARPLAPIVTAVLPPIIVAMWPLVKVAELLRWLMVRGRDGAVFSREELAAMARIGHKEGVIGEGESRILESLFRFRSLRVRDIMTPRTVVYSLPASARIREVLADSEDIRFSRIPVYGEARDEVVGYVLKNDLLMRGAKDELDLALTEISRKLLVVPGTLELPRLFRSLIDDSEHIALVVDEHGGMDGIVTMEDLLESLIGHEIVDEGDPVKDMRELARERWQRRAKGLGVIQESQDETTTTGSPR